MDTDTIIYAVIFSAIILFAILILSSLAGESKRSKHLAKWAVTHDYTFQPAINTSDFHRLTGLYAVNTGSITTITNCLSKEHHQGTIYLIDYEDKRATQSGDSSNHKTIVAENVFVFVSKKLNNLPAFHVMPKSIFSGMMAMMIPKHLQHPLTTASATFNKQYYIFATSAADLSPLEQVFDTELQRFLLDNKKLAISCEKGVLTVSQKRGQATFFAPKEYAMFEELGLDVANAVTK